jgi:translation initiation factor IF-2
MSEPKRSDNSLGSIKTIGSFATEHIPQIQNAISAQRKRIEDVLKRLSAKKEVLYQEKREREERENERIRLQQEKERQLKENEELIKKALEEPLILKPQKKVEAPVQMPEASVSLPAPEEKPAETVARTENPVPTAAQQKTEEKPAESVPEPTSSSQIEDKIRQQIHAPLFAKAKKPVIEKPVIRIYVPPVEENRQKKNNASASSAARPLSGSKAGSTSGNTAARPGTGAGYPSRPAFGQRPAVLPPVLPDITAKEWAKKKGQDKTHSSAVAANSDMDKKGLSKKKLIKKGFEQPEEYMTFDEYGNENTRIIRTRKVSDKKKQQQFVPQTATVIDHAVLTSDHITIKELSEKIGKTGVEIIKKLFLLGIIKTINDTIDYDTADLVSGELGVTLELQRTETSEEKLIAQHVQESVDDDKELKPRPPIVTIMGHVDHGKTSILDYIRKANVAAGEAGGITQHIGAYTVVINGSPITFLDTPGHEAFTAMRARGANVTDIVVIVVAADDGIMPQTIEAINHAKAAKVGIIVAVNKIDKAGADPDRVLTQLTEQGLVPEDWGGNIPVVKVSAKTGQGIPDLLDTILVSAEILELKANPNRSAKGTIIEARLDKGKGPVATVLVQNGTLKISDLVVAGSVTGKIRAMQDDKGRNVAKAGPSMAVSVLGLQEVPDAGDQLMVVSDEKFLKQIADERQAKLKVQKDGMGKISLEDMSKIIAEGKLKTLNLIIKADVQGSVEAIKESLLKLSNEEVKVNVVHAVAGAINESDVLLADMTKSIIIGFNVRPDSNAKLLAEQNNVDIRLYRIIYDAIDDVTNAIKGMLAPKFREQYIGRAEVRVIYKISGVGTIGGCMVKDGKIVRNANARVLRDNTVVCDTMISSLKRLKDDVKEVTSGFECGIGLDNFNDLKEGDIIESFSTIKEQ